MTGHGATRVGQRRGWPNRWTAWHLAATALVWWLWAWASVPYAGWAVLINVVALVGHCLVGWRRRQSSAGTVRRWAARSRRNDGTASTLGLVFLAGRPAMLRKARAVRPSLASVPWWRLLFVPVTEYAVRLCRVGRLWVYASIEDVAGAIGGPRVGKSVAMLARVVDFPGAVVVTSTRTDLLDNAGPARYERTGQSAMVFNPSGVGKIASTVKFSPLYGCEQPDVAYARARDMIGTRAGGDDAERWDRQAQRVLAALMHAAALTGKTMADVSRWVAEPVGHPDDPVNKHNGPDVEKGLRRSPSAGAFVSDYRQFASTNDRTRTSITSTIMPALGWLTSTTAAAAADAEGEPFDVEEFLDRKGQLFLLGAQDDGLVAPLVSAFTGHVAREARRLARDRGGRLDPPLGLMLDEVALVRVPLNDWSADMGGSGTHISYAAQGRTQLESTWGREGGGTILNNTASLMIFGGTRDPDDLNAWSKLSGERLDEDGRLIPVLSGSAIAHLPAWRVLVVNRGMPASVGRVVKAWKRHDIKAALRKHRVPASHTMETQYQRDGLATGIDAELAGLLDEEASGA